MTLLVFLGEEPRRAHSRVTVITNYKYNSAEFHNPGQLYTLHAIAKGEAQPIVLTLVQSIEMAAREHCLRQPPEYQTRSLQS